MARKNNRESFGLQCTVCQKQNYVSQKNTVNTKDKMSFNKYCKSCRKVTPHAEFKLK